MGNYSRNTYDPRKLYTSVRLQQGVPLVDADWNEQADILRNQTHDTFDYALGTGVVPGSSLMLSGDGLQNDFWLQRFGPGKALIDGRLVMFGPIQYSTQPWTNATTAAAAGVPIIPPLTKPSTARNDLVYLDVWEREVNSVEDKNLVNNVIGVETAVRTKWEVAVRVNENALLAPPAPAGHTHMALAVLKRAANVAVIGTFHPEDPKDPICPVLDARPVLPLDDRSGLLTLPPVFFPWSTYAQWTAGFGLKLLAYKPATTATVIGVLPVHLVDGARLTEFSIYGLSSRATFIHFQRSSVATLSTDGYEPLLGQAVSGPDSDPPMPYFMSWPLDGMDPINRIDNRNFVYSIYVQGSGNGTAEIHGMFIKYVL